LSRPKLLIPNVPFNTNTLSLVFPYAISVALVGIVESLLTSQLLDELTDTHSNKNRECVGQGLGNVVTGLFGGIAGCGMIGQTIINYTYGGRGRLSTLTAGTAMLFSIIILNKFVTQIPVVALASVMVVVAISTFNWGSIKRITKVPKSDTLVMISTVVIVLLTNNLAYGVVVGIIISSIAFVAKISDIKVEREEVEGNVVYRVKGQLFFVSTTKFINSFKYNDKVDSVCVDFSEARVWDESAVDAIDKVVVRYSKRKVKVKFKGLSKASAVLVERLSTYDRVKLV
jgi:SulP family sulfate permease